MIGKNILEVSLGETAYFQKTITESDVYLYAGISGDNNPAHINEVYAKRSIFKGRIAHGLLTAGLISTVLGTQLPGPGTIYLSQNLKFLKPVKFNDTIKAEVRIIEIDVGRNRIKLKTICTNQYNEAVLTGEALVIAPKDENFKSEGDSV